MAISRNSTPKVHNRRTATEKSAQNPDAASTVTRHILPALLKNSSLLLPVLSQFDKTQTQERSADPPEPGDHASAGAAMLRRRCRPRSGNLAPRRPSPASLV